MNSSLHNSLPKILFAHRFAADIYHGCLPKHENKVEITIITEGEITVAQSGKEAVAKKGDIIFNAYRDPLFVDTNAYHAHKTVGFLLDADIMSQVEGIPLIIQNKERTLECLFLMDKIIQTYVSDSENLLKLAGLLLQLLGEIRESSNRKESTATSVDFRYVERAKEYIYKNISVPILQKDIAEYLGITPEYLCSVFKRVEGSSVIRFVNEIKLMHIRTMMKNKNLSLNQAAVQFGFSDPNYVSKLYKKYYHETITQAVKR